MSPGHDRGRPGGSGLDVDNGTDNVTVHTPSDETTDVGTQVRSRREAARRLPPLLDGRRDPLDPLPRATASVRQRSSSSRNVVSIRVRGGVALVKGWPAVELLEAVAAPRQWSKAGKGYVIAARFVPDVLACAESRRCIVAFAEEQAA